MTDTIEQELDAFRAAESSAADQARTAVKRDIKYIQITGFYNGFSGSFRVAPAPDAGPLVTGGFPIFNVVQRPQRTSLTVAVGYDPVTIDIPVRFDCWASGNTADAQDIEIDISTLEWMYGRGLAGAAAGEPGARGKGPPPVVQIATYNHSGQVIPLLSSNWQSIQGGSTKKSGQTSTLTSKFFNNAGGGLYNITNISWDPNPLRVPADQPFGGCRLRQDATISLQQIVADPFYTTPGTPNPTPGSTQTYVTKQGDTFMKIAETVVTPAANRSHVTAIATAIMSTYFSSGGKKLVRSLTKAQPAGITIKITSKDKAASP